MALERTPLFDTHVASGARMVDFGGWEMPLHYGSQIEEHKAVRGSAGMFDVSHMTIIDLDGPGAFAYLRNLTANDPETDRRRPRPIRRVAQRYRRRGGRPDRVSPRERWRAVVNAATRAKVLAWFTDHATGFDVKIEHRGDLAMIAVQGPQAIERFEQVSGVRGAAT